MSKPRKTAAKKTPAKAVPSQKRLPPLPALVVGLAGLLPFIYGAMAAGNPDISLEFAPPLLMVEIFGPIVFAYMSGVFWGFATAENQADSWGWLGLSILPAIYVFVAMFAAPGETLTILLIGFPALLPIDYLFWRVNMTPRWWMALRIVLTVVVTAALWVAGENAGYAL